VTKADLIAKIAQDTELDKLQVQSTIESFFNVVKDSMESGENIYVRGFGSFVNKKRARKVARNISKGTAVVVEPHYVPSFKPSKNFVDRVKASSRVRMREEAKNA
jgi:DNA-binding protein HU-beta